MTLALDEPTTSRATPGGRPEDPAYRAFSAAIEAARENHQHFLTRTLARYGVPGHVIEQMLGSFDDTVVEVVDAVFGWADKADLLPGRPQPHPGPGPAPAAPGL